MSISNNYQVETNITVCVNGIVLCHVILGMEFRFFAKEPLTEIFFTKYLQIALLTAAT